MSQFTPPMVLGLLLPARSWWAEVSIPDTYMIEV